MPMKKLDTGYDSDLSDSESSSGEFRRKSKFFPYRNVSESEDGERDTENETKKTGGNAFESFPSLEKKNKKLEHEERGMKKRNNLNDLLANEFDDDSEEESEKRIVVSHRQKRIIELRELAEIIPEAIANSDWITVAEKFQDANKNVSQMMSSDNVLKAPYVFIKLLLETQKSVFAMNKDRKYKKKLAPTQKKELGSLRNKTNNVVKEYQEFVDEYENDPEEYEETAKLIDDQIIQTKPKDTDRDEDDSSTSSTSSSSEEIDESTMTIQEIRAKRRKKWLKPDAGSSSDESDSDEERGRRRKEKKKTEKEKRQLRRANKARTQDQTFVQSQTQLKKKKWTDAEIMEKMEELRSERKRKVNIDDVKKDLIELSKAAREQAVKLQVKMEWLATTLEGFASNFGTSMKKEMFMQCCTVLMSCLNMARAEKFKKITFQQLPSTGAPLEPKKDVIYLSYNFIAAYEFLDDVFWRNLQACADNPLAYIEHLEVEWSIERIAEQIYHFYQDSEINAISSHRQAVLAIRILKHLYYRTDEEHCIILKEHGVILKENEVYYNNDYRLVTEDLNGLIESSVQSIYKNSPDLELHYEGLLMHIFYLAVNGRFHNARQLIQKGGFDSLLHSLPVQVLTLYNRAVVQLGICAFKLGHYSDATTLLAPIMDAQDASALLGQRIFNNDVVNIDLERSRILPVHMHINTDMLESIYLISAMISKIPKRKSCAFDIVSSEYYVLNRFDYIMSKTRGRNFIAPPELPKEYVYHAYVELMKCNWKGAFELLEELKCWKFFEQPQEMKSQVRDALKIAGLHLYLFRFSKFYENISLGYLEEFFELSKEIVHSNISKLIVQQELFVTIDEPSNTINCDTRTEPIPLQRSAKSLSDSISVVQDLNNAIFKNKSQRSGRSDDHHRDSRRPVYRHNTEIFNREATITQICQHGFQNIRSGKNNIPKTKIPLKCYTENGDLVQLESTSSSTSDYNNPNTVVQIVKNYKFEDDRFHVCVFWVKKSDGAQNAIDRYNQKLRELVGKASQVSQLSRAHFLQSVVHDLPKPEQNFYPFKLLIQFDDEDTTYELSRSRDKFVPRSPTAGTDQDERLRKTHIHRDRQNHHKRSNYRNRRHHYSNRSRNNFRRHK